MIRVFVSDDHAVVRHGIEQILAQTSDIEFAGEAENPRELSGILRNTLPDVLVLDLPLRDRGGFDALREIRREHPAMPILVFSRHAEEHFAVRAVRSGASGFLTKSSTPAELVEAIRNVHLGRRYLSPSVLERLANDLGRETPSQAHDALSDRELQVARLISSGKKAAEIAAELFLSVRTVNTYRSRVLEKLHMHSTAELIRYFIELQLVH